MHNKSTLVIGGAGYIGSHFVLELQKKYDQIVVLDNFSTGHRDFVTECECIEGNLGDFALLDQVFNKYNINTVVHFAALSNVSESVAMPEKYYSNNVQMTLNLLNKMVEHKIFNFIFSSTCSTYGEPDYLPLDEKHKLAPVTPYGNTKRFVENILIDYDRAYGIKYIIFRYFNAAGADLQARRGERHDPEFHLIPLALKAAAGLTKKIDIYGTNYKTTI